MSNFGLSELMLAPTEIDVWSYADTEEHSCHTFAIIVNHEDVDMKYCHRLKSLVMELEFLCWMGKELL